MNHTPSEPRHFKRYRLEFDFSRTAPERATLPEGYRWRVWHPADLDVHALVKRDSFLNEPDTQLFLSLSTFKGCHDLMRGICTHPGFVPQATWLIEFVGNEFAEHPCCATIQGIAQTTKHGSIQNVGVVPAHRGLGLGKALVLKSLAGFRAQGLERVYLEVTATNRPAMKVYRSIGFRHVSTSYKELPIASVEKATDIPVSM